MLSLRRFVRRLLFSFLCVKVLAGRFDITAADVNANKHNDPGVLNWICSWGCGARFERFVVHFTEHWCSVAEVDNVISRSDRTQWVYTSSAAQPPEMDMRGDIGANGVRVISDARFFFFSVALQTFVPLLSATLTCCADIAFCIGVSVGLALTGCAEIWERLDEI